MKLVFASLMLSLLGSCAALDVRGTLLLPGGAVAYGNNTVEVKLDGKQVIDLRK